MNRRILLLHYLVGVLVLAIILRTWLVMGLVEPVRIAGSSMTPTLRGAHESVVCERCGNRFEVGAEFASDGVECFRCGFDGNTANPHVRAGDALLVDRNAFRFRPPRRWELVVFRSPEDGELVVKRVAGLPGETIHLIHGDVCIDGHVARKSLESMRAMRQLIHAEGPGAIRWKEAAGSSWQWRGDAWGISASGRATHWLQYHHLGEKVITDDSAYNAGLTRRLFAVRDFALSAVVNSHGPWSARLAYAGSDETAQWDIRGSTTALLEVFAFDRRVETYLDGQLVARSELSDSQDVAGTASPFSIGMRRSDVELRELRIYRDIYHASREEQASSAAAMRPVTLRPDEIFVLGDNPPVSMDSRHWGPVPMRLLVGKPLCVR